MKLIGMKESPKREQVYYYLELSSKEEIELYLEKFQGEFKTFFKKLINGEEPPRRWDHVKVEGTPAALFYSAIVKMKISETTPYEAINEMADLKVKGLYELQERYGAVAVNLDTGTMRPPFDEKDTIVSCEDVSDFNIAKDDYATI